MLRVCLPFRSARLPYLFAFVGISQSKMNNDDDDDDDDDDNVFAYVVASPTSRFASLHYANQSMYVLFRVV